MRGTGIAQNSTLPSDWPLPELKVPMSAPKLRTQRGLDDEGRPVIAFAPGAVGPSKRWPIDPTPKSPAA
jgi:heptosyltransferase-2